jgi:hypothetical protein
MERLKAGREVISVQTPWGSVQAKVKVLDGQAMAVSPEYEDCARLARENNVPLLQVYEAAQAAARAALGKGAGSAEPPEP